MRPGAPPLPAHAVKEPTLLGEAFDADGSISAAGVDRVVEAVDRAVRADRLRWEGPPDRAIGTSKTFKQLARLAGAPPQRMGPFARRQITAGDLDEWVPRLAKLRARQRAKLPGVSQPRARQIVAGAIVAKAAMKALHVRSVDVCPWALREGIILSYLQTTLNEPLVLPLLPLHQVVEGAGQLRALEPVPSAGNAHWELPVAPGAGVNHPGRMSDYFSRSQSSPG